VKSGAHGGGPDRDRAYWEEPHGIGRIAARIEEIEPPEPGSPPVRPERPRRRIWARVPPSRLAAGAGAALLVAAVAVANWPSGRPDASPSGAGPASAVAGLETAGYSPSSLPSPTLSPTPYVPPTYAWPTPHPQSTPYPTPTDTPEPEPSFVVARGWPVTGETDAGLGPTDVVVGPDGTVYLDGQPPIDAGGRSKIGWLRLPDRSYGLPVLFAADGTIYVTEGFEIPGTFDDPSVTEDTNLFAFGKDGKLKSGWPVAVGLEPEFELGTSGTVVVDSVVGLSEQVTVLAPNGATVASWVLGNSYGSMCGRGVGRDGALYFAYSEAGAPCSIVVYSPTGKRLSKAPSRIWDSLTVSAAGEVVAIGYDSQPYSASTVARSRLAVIGEDGQPVAGWPVSLEGAASAPAFGSDGTMYVTQLGLGTSPSKVLALTPGGQPVSGWPVDLPGGYGPFSADGATPKAPVVSTSGIVTVAATDLSWMGWIVALDPSGAALPGWPYRLPQPLANFDGGGVRGESPYNPGPILAASGSSVAVYLALDGRLDAIGPGGTELPGWPYSLPQDDAVVIYWELVVPTPDGGVVAVTSVPDTGAYSIIRLTTSGAPAH
jgi:hypothetical protein